MNKLYIKLIWPALFVVLLGGCSKILDVKPVDALSEEDNFLARTSVRHTLMQFSALMEAAVPPTIVYADLRGDYLTVNSNTDPYLRELDNQDISLANTYVDPKPYYRIIINANDILAKYRQAAKNDPSISSSDTIAVLYQTLGARGWAYLQLSRIYRKVPFFTQNIRTNTGFAYTMLTRAQIADSMASIFSILNNNALGEGSLGLAFDNPDTYFNRIIFNTYSALLVKGEWLRENGDYTGALDCYNAILLNNGLTAYPDKYRITAGIYPNNQWANRFTPNFLIDGGWNTTMDLVLCAWFNQNKGEVNYLYNLFYPTTYTGCTYQLKPTDFAVANWKSQIKLITVNNVVTQAPGDYRGLKASYDTISGDVSKCYVNKYRNKYSQIVVYRASDINFLWAESRTLLGYPTNGLNLINPQVPSKGQNTPFPNQVGIRGKVSLDSVIKAPYTHFLDTLTGIKKVMLAILDERGLELAYEGKRWFDLVRIAEALNDPAILADRVALKYTDPAKAAAIRQKLMNPDNWYLTFPTNKLPEPGDTIQTQ